MFPSEVDLCDSVTNRIEAFEKRLEELENFFALMYANTVQRLEKIADNIQEIHDALIPVDRALMADSENEFLENDPPDQLAIEAAMTSDYSDDDYESDYESDVSDIPDR